MKVRFYTHPVTHVDYIVECSPFTTRQGKAAHIVSVHPRKGGAGDRFVRYSGGQYAKHIGSELVPVALSGYYPRLSLRGLI